MADNDGDQQPTRSEASVDLRHLLVVGTADALPETLATVSLGKVTLRGVATMLARQLRDDNIHAGSLTILGQIAAGTPLEPDRIADEYWAIRNEGPDDWLEEYRFDGVAATSRLTPATTSSVD